MFQTGDERTSADPCISQRRLQLQSHVLPVLGGAKTRRQPPKATGIPAVAMHRPKEKSAAKRQRLSICTRYEKSHPAGADEGNFFRKQKC